MVSGISTSGNIGALSTQGGFSFCSGHTVDHDGRGGNNIQSRVYYPEGKTERALYKIWEEGVMVYGRNLQAVYEKLQNNTPEILRESEGRQDSDTPYIERIEYRVRL